MTQSLSQIFSQAAPAATPPAGEAPATPPEAAAAQLPGQAPLELAAPETPAAPAGEQSAASPETPAAPPPESPEARARVDLERRDRELFQRETWLSQKMNEIRQYEQIRQLARENPAEAARQLGIDTLRLAEGLMGGGGAPQEQAGAGTGDKVLDYIKKLEGKIDSLEGGLQAQNSSWEIRTGLSASREQYPMLSTVAESNPQFVGQLHELRKQYQQSGRAVELQELLQQQEDFYTQSMLQSLTKILTVPKLKDKVSELLKQQTGATQKQPPSAAPAAQQKTLRNNMTAEAPTELPRPTTPDEAALAARKFKLWAD